MLAATGCGSDGSSPDVFGSNAPVESVQPALTAPPTTSLQKLTYKLGPFELPAGTSPQAMRDLPASIKFQTEDPLWFTAFESRIENAEGGELSTSLLHMATVSNESEQNPLCTDNQVANPFVVVTGNTTSIELPIGVGYAILPEDQLNARVILQNPTLQDYKNVYFVFTMTAVSMKSAKNMQDVYPLLLDVNPCNHNPITVAPNEFTKKESTFTIPENGLLTKAYGLLQDYGVEVSLTAKDQPTPFWIAQAELSEKHEVIEILPFEDPAGIPLNEGDSLSLSVAYDNSNDSWLSEATGAAMVYMTRTGEKKKDTITTEDLGADLTKAQMMILK